jgi:hypothetical protein
VSFSPGGKTKVKHVRLGALSSLKGKKGNVVCEQKLLLLWRYPSDTITAVIRCRRRPHCLDLAELDEKKEVGGGNGTRRKEAQFAISGDRACNLAPQYLEIAPATLRLQSNSACKTF